MSIETSRMLLLYSSRERDTQPVVHAEARFVWESERICGVCVVVGVIIQSNNNDIKTKYSIG
jgi:urea transporter